MSNTNLIRDFEPLYRLLPSVEPPSRYSTDFNKKFTVTAFCLFIYLICSNVPLYGVDTSYSSDPFMYLRAILASNRGTLMELGISPIVTASMLLTILSAMQIIEMDKTDREDYRRMEGATKLLGFLLIFFESVGLVVGGHYGLVSILSFNGGLIAAQLIIASSITVLLDEVMEKHGLGHGISVFIAINIAESILWQVFSPITIAGNDSEASFEGIFINLVHKMLTEDWQVALSDSFFRERGENLMNLIATVFVIMVVLYMEGWHNKVSLSRQGNANDTYVHKVKLLYTSNTPIILQTTMISNMALLSYMLWERFPDNVFVQFFGDYTDQRRLKNGLMYFVTRPESFVDPFLRSDLMESIRVFSYAISLTITCMLLSYLWARMSGQDSKTISNTFKTSQFRQQGHRTMNLYKRFESKVEPSALMGGMLVGMITVMSDAIGCLSSGMGLLLCISTIYDLYEKIYIEEKEKKKAD